MRYCDWWPAAAAAAVVVVVADAADVQGLQGLRGRALALVPLLLGLRLDLLVDLDQYHVCVLQAPLRHAVVILVWADDSGVDGWRMAAGCYGSRVLRRDGRRWGWRRHLQASERPSRCRREPTAS